MRVTGRATIDAPREAVFAAICDPGTLLEAIPGCQEMSQVSAAEYRGRIVLKLPAMVGTYDTVVRLVHADPPASGEIEGRVEGSAGTIDGRATFRLDDEGERTVVEYDGSGVVSGPLARLDSRFVEGLAVTLIDQGFARLGKRLQAERAEAAR